jgi:hypothetical protein
MRQHIFAFLLIFTLVFACKNKSEKLTTISSNNENISLLDTLTLRLNKGKKWIVNPDTQIGIIKMDSIIKTFKADDNSDYLILGKELAIETGQIIRSCNMTGEAHDQLHVLLVPMLDEISILKESENTYESRKALGELESLIEAYFNHFEN